MFLGDHQSDVFAWPPSPQKVLVMFPTVKALYFQLYRAVANNLDKRLDAIISQARNLQGETEQPDVAREEAHRPEPEGNGIINIVGELRLEDGGAAQPQNAPGAAPQNENPAPARLDRAGTGLGSVVNALAGALMWPTVSYWTGSLLQSVLPPAWVNKPGSGPATGLLQERWGRSLVGGCLFVVLKDAFFLYIKWRRAINRPYRRIRNVERRAREN
jgi:hypothetical protein